jgi:hypothetical protein
MHKKLKPALFLHIQKTAGTSVQAMARVAYGNLQVVSHGDYISLGAEGCRHKAFVSGHFGFDYAKSLMTGRYNFTFLRNPQERIFSLYRYCRSSPRSGGLNEIAKQYDFGTFLQSAVDSEFFSHVWNNQVWQLSYGFGSNTIVHSSQADSEHLLMLAKENMDKMNYIGLVETFEKDIGKIFTQKAYPLDAGVATSCEAQPPGRRRTFVAGTCE